MSGVPQTPGSPPRAVVVVGASAGGIDALRRLLGLLPADLPAAVLVVVHLASGYQSALARILARGCDLQVETAADGAPLRNGVVSVATPGCHLVVHDGRLRVGPGPRENGHRPAIDPLFRSAARWYGTGVTAVVLSGTLDDGAAGSLTVAARGGVVLVQDPDEAAYSGMPEATLRAVAAAEAAPVGRLAEILKERVGRLQQPLPVAVGEAAASRLVAGTDPTGLDSGAVPAVDPPGTSPGLARLGCDGVLFEIYEQPLPGYPCRVGDARSSESLKAERSEELESALWVALRSLEERAALHRKLAADARGRGRLSMVALSEDRASEAERSAEVIRQLLHRLSLQAQD